MKNFEKYEDEVRKFKDGNFCEEFVIPHILKSNNCAYLSCSDCGRRQMLWFVEECEESETDWNQIEVDTPILVRFKEDKEWVKRHFAKYENGFVYAWKDSHTSWTSLHDDDVTIWRYAKLAKDEGECKDPEVDWSKVKVDTPVLVRDGENNEWQRSYFAKYENGFVYTWIAGATSWTAVGYEKDGNVYRWNYAKLAEDEEKNNEKL